MDTLLLDWEKIENNDMERTWRLKVPGGWVVQFYRSEKIQAALFVPDANHEWEPHPAPLVKEAG